MGRHAPILFFSNIDRLIGDMSDDAGALAGEVLRALDKASVFVVLCSSRTRAEIEAAQQALGIAHPFVCENGCAAFVPGGYFQFELPESRTIGGYSALEFGRPYSDVARALRNAADRQTVGVDAFHDMPVEDVARSCRMSLLQARLAKLREYGERFRILDADETARDRLFGALARIGFRCFADENCHQVGTAVNPAKGVEQIYRLYRRAYGAIVSVGAAEATAPFSSARLVEPSPHRTVDAVRDWSASLMSAVTTLRRRL